MNLRSLGLGTLAAAAILAGVTAHQAEAQRARITIGTATLSPNRLPGTGGLVTVRVKVTGSGGLAVTSVNAFSQLKTSSNPGGRVALAPAPNGFYQGQVRVPANSKPQRTTADITVEATGGGSSQAISKRVGRVQVDAFSGDPTSPPPPPDI